ncbi:MAG: CBS domain-containing protein [Desulfosarcina sp.]|nr:CBS domain-containing protein [Desulfosarcina sp.]MBC2742990.1 CBS domain-containing protein [Desulfosarcina sp.]MBC2765900.1 CBS domain-containing protein [Desulfosarcina sp.]
MTIYAKDVMVASFDKIHQDAPIEKAINLIQNGKVRETGHKTISLMVVDDYGQLTGVVSMYDILYHLRPDFLNISVDAGALLWTGQLKRLVETLKGKKVYQVMSMNVVSASLDDHIMVILDQMIKNKYRRLPILEHKKPIGIIYISDVYCNIFSSIL